MCLVKVVLTNDTHCIYIACKFVVRTKACTDTYAQPTGPREEGARNIMLKAHEQQSEVARLLSQISDEYEAARRGLTGLSYGMSQHDFITARMENMGQLHTQLQSIVGDVAIALIADRLNTVHS